MEIAVTCPELSRRKIRLVELAEEYRIKKMIVSSAVVKEATMDQLQYMVEKGAFIEYTFAAYTHTTTIPKTHYYVEREYASIDEGMSGEFLGGVKLVAEQIDETVVRVLRMEFHRVHQSTRHRQK